MHVDCRELEGREDRPSAAIIDSQSVKTGPNARDSVGYDAGKRIKGRKRRIITDTVGLLLKADVRSAGIQDRDGAARLFDKLTARFPFVEVIIGDGGYAGPKVRKAAPRPVEIVKRPDRARGSEVLPKRWIVERTLTWLTINRRLARDFERYAQAAASFIQIAMRKDSLNDLPLPLLADDWSDPLEEAVRQSIRGFIEALLEGELERALGRGRYQRVARATGYRNGHRAIAALWAGVPVQRCTVHKQRNLLAHAPKALHEEITADYSDMMYAKTAGEAIAKRKAFLKKWRLRCRGVADSLEEAGDRLFTFLRYPPSQWKSLRTTKSHCAPPTRSSAGTRSSSAGSRPSASCPQPKPRPCCFGPCWPAARSPCDGSTAGTPSMSSQIESRLT